MSKQDDDYCLNLVRDFDKDRYLAALFAPEAKRPHLFALYAFNAEIVKARDAVREPALGEIRMQWWQDTLDGIYGGEPQNHPVAIALARAIASADLPKHALVNLVKAHVFDFYSDAMPNMADLEGYLGETSSALIQLATLILAGEEGLQNAEASGLAGVAYGLAGLLRNIPAQRAKLQCFLPLDMLVARQATVDDFMAGENEASISVVLAELREAARSRLAQARKMAWTIKPSAMPAFLHVTLTDGYLDTVAAKGSDLIKSGAQVSQWRKQWALWRAARTEMF
jgi:15-cis-phytoene synthase